jgi:hypothetical protein
MYFVDTYNVSEKKKKKERETMVVIQDFISRTPLESLFRFSFFLSFFFFASSRMSRKSGKKYLPFFHNAIY